MWVGYSGVIIYYLDGLCKVVDIRLIGFLEGGGVLIIGYYIEYFY